MISERSVDMPFYPSDIAEHNIQRLKQRWTLRTHGYVTAKPLFMRNHMLICDWDGYIYCLNAMSGKVIYEKQLYQPPKENAFLHIIPIVNRFLGEPLPYLWRGFAGTGCLSDDIWYLASVGGKEGGMLTGHQASCTPFMRRMAQSYGNKYSVNNLTPAVLLFPPVPVTNYM